MSRRYIAYICALVSIAAARCGAPGLAPVDLSGLPQREATAAELVALVNAQADSVKTVRAELKLSFRNEPGGKARGCSGKLLAQRGAGGAGASIHLKGYRKLMPTFFTLVSDGAEFWLHVPIKNTVYTGPVGGEDPAAAAGRDALADSLVSATDTSGVYVETADLARALFVEPIDTSLESRLSLEGGHYVLEVVQSGEIRRRLRIERRLFCIVEETYYTRGGAKELELLRSEYAIAACALYPLRMAIVSPPSGIEIVLDIEELELGSADFDPGAFRFSPPRGAKIERI